MSCFTQYANAQYCGAAEYSFTLTVDKLNFNRAKFRQYEGQTKLEINLEKYRILVLNERAKSVEYYQFQINEIEIISDNTIRINCICSPLGYSDRIEGNDHTTISISIWDYEKQCDADYKVSFTHRFCKDDFEFRIKKPYCSYKEKN